MLSSAESTDTAPIPADFGTPQEKHPALAIAGVGAVGVLGLSVLALLIWGLTVV